MDIQNELLKRVLSKPFGWNLAKRNLLESSSSEDNTDDGKNNDLAIIDDALSQRAGRRLVAEEINKQKNMEDVVQRADEILQAEPATTTNGEESDQGWVEECLDGAGKAYNEDLKNYWARLLAGEIKHPSFYSLRAIQFMKSLSKTDADKIKKMCQYVVYNYDNTDAIILRYKPSEYTFDEISFLMELRLLNYNHSIVKQYTFDESEGFAFFRKKDVGLFIKIKRKEYNLPIYSFTELGKEILTIIDDVDINRQYLNDFCKSITEKKDFIEVTGGDLEGVDDRYHFVKNDNYFEIPETGNNISVDARKE